MPSTLGDVTTSLFNLEVKSHTHHIEFEVAVANKVKPGQPVQLETNGKVTAMPSNSANAETKYIGISILAGDGDAVDAAGRRITVAVIGMAVINGKSEKAMNAGPVLYKGLNGNDNNKYDDDDGVNPVTTVNQVGWSLKSATAADQDILVMVK